MAPQTASQTALRTARRTAIGLGAALAIIGIVGCDKGGANNPQTPESLAAPTTAPGSLGAGGAPTYGEPTGTGFPSGDAAHASGGSGLAGFHGTGAMGTSATISDAHDAGKPAKDAAPPVLPEQ